MYVFVYGSNRLILQTNLRRNVIVVIMRAQSNLKTIPDNRRCNSIINKLYSCTYKHDDYENRPNLFTPMVRAIIAYLITNTEQ